MRLNSRCGINNRKAFNFFKSIYEDQLKKQSNCELAFQQSIMYFHDEYGYNPYENLDDYLNELFAQLNGFQLFK